MLFVLVLSVLLAVACGGGVTSVDVRNMSGQEFKLSESATDHLNNGATKKDVCIFNTKGNSCFLQIWRQTNCLAQWTIEALVVNADEDKKENLRTVITITADEQDQSDPFDDIFTATPSNAYVSVSSRYDCQTN